MVLDNGFNFKECEFIDDEMKFYTYKDFLQNCYAIKRLYDKYLSSNGKLFYMWYVYSNVHITMNQKNKIWSFLNDYESYENLKTLCGKSKYI